VQPQSFHKSQGSNWFSNLNPLSESDKDIAGFKVEYVPRSQLHYLGLMHKSIHQNVKIKCENSIVYYDEANNNYNNSINIETFGGRVLNLKEHEHITDEYGNVLFQIKNMSDDMCSFKTLGETEFDIETTVPLLLPITDFELKEYGTVNEKFGFSLAPVCYTS